MSYKIDDQFNFPEINEFKDEFLIEGQQYFWFLVKDNAINTEVCDIILNNDKYEITNKRFHQPHEYLNNLEEDIKSYYCWGITNNSNKDYYDLKVDNNGIFYTQTNEGILSYKIILDCKEQIYELTKENLKFKNALLFKQGHAFLSIGQSNQLSLDNFIVGYSAELYIDENKKIDIELIALVPNITNKYHPQFTIKLTPNYELLADIKIESFVVYRKMHIDEEYQVIPPVSTTEINLIATGYNE